MKLLLFPESLLELDKEILHHPDLMINLNQLNTPDLEMRLALICAYCEIIVDGTYTAKEIEHLAGICLKKLKHRRSGNLIDISSTVADDADAVRPVKH